MSANKQRKGFTLIELLTAVAIIGLLGSLIMAAIGRRQIANRDVKRLADFSQLQKSLDLALAGARQYPLAPTGIILGDPSHRVLCAKGIDAAFVSDTSVANCDSDKIYVQIVPRDPSSPDSEYVYKTYPGGGSYCIQTVLDVGGINSLVAGPIFADQDSVVNGTCP